MKLQNKQVQLLFLVLICMFAYTTWYINAANNDKVADDYEGIIRFHVIANSNSPVDQSLKLQVRDQVLETINEELVKETMANSAGGEKVTSLTKEESRAYIKRNLHKIEEISEEVIKEHGFDYSVGAKLGVCWIPEKTYGETVFPAGNYEALNITIGKGEGENWWCVLFPPMCIIDPQPSSTPAAITSDAINVKPRADEAVTEGGIKLKFKTLELIDSFSSKS